LEMSVNYWDGTFCASMIFNLKIISCRCLCLYESLFIRLGFSFGNFCAVSNNLIK
jgi:hypothetical protein